MTVRRLKRIGVSASRFIGRTNTLRPQAKLRRFSRTISRFATRRDQRGLPFGNVADQRLAFVDQTMRLEAHGITDKDRQEIL